MFVCFDWKLTWHLGQNKQESSDWESQQLNWPSVLVFGVHEFQHPP